MSRTAIFITGFFIAAAVASGATALMGSGASTPSDTPTPAPEQSGNRWSLAVTATDTGFEFPIDALPPGRAALDLLVTGSAPQELQIFQLAPDTSFAGFEKVARRWGPTDRLFQVATPVGGIGSGGGVVPGESQRVVLDLDLGVYGFVSFVNDNYTKALVSRFDVSEGVVTPAGEPPTLGDVTMSDAGFGLGAKELAPGVWKVVNEGDQIHETAAFRLDAPVEELLDELDRDQDPPGGVAGFGIMAPGRFTYSESKLPPGQYAFVCRLLDPDTQRPFYQSGMLAEFRVE